MAEENKKSTSTIKKPASKPLDKDIIIAIIQHASLPLAFVLIALFFIILIFSLKTPIATLLESTQELKLGSFEIQLQESVASAKMNKELSGLRSLSDDQIQLFLVIGKGDREHISYWGPEVNETNLSALYEIGLLSEYKQQQNEQWFWSVSLKGTELHNIIFSHLVSTIQHE